MRKLGRWMIVGAGLAAVLAPGAGAVKLGDLCGTTVTSNAVIVKSQETINQTCPITVDLGVKLKIEKSEIAVNGNLEIWGEKDAGVSIKNSTVVTTGNLEVSAWASDVRVKKSDLVAAGDLSLITSGDYPVFRVERNTLVAGCRLRLARDSGLLIADDNDCSADRISVYNDSGDIDIYDNVFVASSLMTVSTAGITRSLTAVDNSMTVTNGDLFLEPWGKELLMDNDFQVDGNLRMRGWIEIQVIDNYFDVGGDITITMEDPGGICQTSGNTGDPVACE